MKTVWWFWREDYRKTFIYTTVAAGQRRGGSILPDEIFNKSLVLPFNRVETMQHFTGIKVYFSREKLRVSGKKGSWNIFDPVPRIYKLFFKNFPLNDIKRHADNQQSLFRHSYYYSFKPLNWHAQFFSAFV